MCYISQKQHNRGIMFEGYTLQSFLLMVLVIISANINYYQVKLNLLHFSL